MTDINQIAAIVASGLVNNDLYKKCTRISDYNLNRPATYVLDVEGIARDAWAIALKIEEAERDRNRKAR
jgi:hypothetical protein